LFVDCLSGDFAYNITIGGIIKNSNLNEVKFFNKAAKDVFKHLLKNKIVSEKQIFDHLYHKYEAEMTNFSNILREFLT
jgi:hypothetical protein